MFEKIWTLKFLYFIKFFFFIHDRAHVYACERGREMSALHRVWSHYHLLTPVFQPIVSWGLVYMAGVFLADWAGTEPRTPYGIWSLLSSTLSLCHGVSPVLSFGLCTQNLFCSLTLASSLPLSIFCSVPGHRFLPDCLREWSLLRTSRCCKDLQGSIYHKSGKIPIQRTVGVMRWP